MSSPQIYVEIERARLTKTLASIKEQSGEVKEAASILQELQVRDLILIVRLLGWKKKNLHSFYGCEWVGVVITFN